MALARYQSTVTDEAGNIVPNATIEVRLEVAGSPLAALKSDRAGNTPMPNPFTAEANGYFGFHVAGGAYRIQASKVIGGELWEAEPIRYAPVGLGAESDQIPTPEGMDYLWSTDTANTDPTAGFLKVNHATLSSATALRISETDANGVDLSGLLATFDDSSSTIRGLLMVRKVGAPEVFAIFQITSDVTDSGTWDSWTVAYVTHAGTLANNDPVQIQFWRSGDQGEDGSTTIVPFSFTGDGTTDPYTLPAAAAGAAYVSVQIDGVTQRPTTDYTVSGDQLTPTSAWPNGLPIYGVVFTSIALVDVPQTDSEVADVPAAEAESFPDEKEFVRIAGYAAPGDGGSALYKEVAESGPLLPGQFRSNTNLRRWENAENTITPAMFANIEEMFEFSRAQIQMPAGNYEFDAPVIIRAGAVIRAEAGAILIPTFEPTGVDRATPLITCGAGLDANYLHLQLDAGIDTIRIGVEIGDNSQVGVFKATSVDLNNNRTEAGSTDLISGALLLRGEHIRVGQVFLDRFDRGWAVIDSEDVIIGKIRNLETVMGGYVHGTRDLHVLAAYTTGPTDPTEPNGFVNGRGVMTPGANSLCLAGCSDSSFSNWQSFDILEHAIRVGQVASGTIVPNHRLAFSNVQSHRPYGCGFKMDDADDNNIRRVLIDGLYTEDVGKGNWFGTVGFTNWSQGSEDDPANNNDGNKQACAIRNSGSVRLSNFQNRANTQTASGYYGLWVERSNDVLCQGVDTEASRSHGVMIANNGIDINRITINGVRSSLNGGDGFNYTPGSNHVCRGLSVTDLKAGGNTGYGAAIAARPDTTSQFTSTDGGSVIQGWAKANTAGQTSYAAAVNSDADLVKDVI